MNSDWQAAERPSLNGQSDLLARRHDSLKCSNSDASNTNGTPSAAVAPLESENDASQGIETFSNGTSSKDTAQQQSSSHGKRLQHQGSHQGNSSEDGKKFPTREPMPGQPLFALLIKPSDRLQAGDHILYQSSRPPFRMTYRSALVTEIQGTDGSLKVNVITNAFEIGVTKKQIYFDQLKNLHKVEYDMCRYSNKESIERAKRRWKLKEKCYHALHNNSHFFVTWCKTGREYPLTDILEEINQDPSVTNKINLAPIFYKTTVTKMLKRGDHVVLDSQHYLIDSVEEGNSFSAYFINKEKQVDRKEAITWKSSGFTIQCSEHQGDTDSLKHAAEELKRENKWKGTDLFITAMKCGRQHPVNNECIIDHNVTLTGYTQITPKEKVIEGDHLVFTDLKNSLRSVLVMKCFDHMQVTVKPQVDEGEIIDLTTYPEVYRVNYSSSLPPEETLIRGSSDCGLKQAQKFSQNDHSLFVTWAKTGKQLSLSPLQQKFAIESLRGNLDQIQVGDHIVEYAESNRKHFMVTSRSEASMFTLIFCQAGGLIRKETMDLSHKELYRIVYLQKCLPSHEAIARAKSQIGQQKYSPWDQMLFIVQAKSGEDEHEDVCVSHCKQLALKEKVSDGEHLIVKDNQMNLHSVIVVNCLDHTIKPPVNGSDVLNLASYLEVYRVEYSDSLPPKGVKSEKKLSLPLSEFIKAKFAIEAISTVSQIHVGDHLIECVHSSSHKHYIITEIKKKSVFAVIFRQGGYIEEEVLDFSNKQLNRLVCHQKSQSVQEALERAKFQLGQQCQIPWDELLLTMQAKSSKMPVSKSQITSFSQLQLGDYVVKELRMGNSHHYIIAFIGLPDICTAIESFQGKISQENLPHPEPDKYTKFYRMNYEPGVCIAAKESVKLALSLVGKKYSRRGFVQCLKTNEENTEINESSVEVASHNCDVTEHVRSPVSKSEITDISQLQLGDYIVKEPRMGPAHHYIITSIASSGTCNAIESYQGKTSSVNLPSPQAGKYPKYYRMNYNPGSCVPAEESIKKALLLVAESKNFVHFLKTNEEDAEIHESLIPLATKGRHNYAAPQYIKPVATINEIKRGDHIVYNATRPPIMPLYCSALILEVHTEGSNEVDVITLEKKGLVEKQLNFEFLENLGKVVYQGCPFSEMDAFIRGKKALQFKQKEHYDEQCNNCHHFVTRIKTGRENALSELLRIFVRTNKDKKPSQLKPVLTKVLIVGLSEISPADHILIGSDHFLVRSVNVKYNTLKCYAIDTDKHIICETKTDLIGGKNQIHRIDYDSRSRLYGVNQTLRFAEEESQKEETKWERSDIFVTMAKCGAGFIIDDRCIMPNVIDTHCTDIVGTTSVDNGDHLLIKDEKTGRFCSVLVYKFYHQTKIEVIPSITRQSFEREIIDLTKYKEKYRVNYSYSLPSVEVKLRAESQVGQDLLQQCPNDSSDFISWAKTGKERELSVEVLLQNSKRICVIRPISYDKILSPKEIRVGDHLFWDKDKVKSYRKHIMVTKCGVDGDPTKFMTIYCSKTRFKEKVKIFTKSMGQDTYRINYPEALPTDLALKRARSQLGEHNFKPLARMWFVRWAKTGSDEGIEVSFLKNNTRPVTKSRISCFTQLNPGDYIVAEPKMNFYHHYIVLSIESPTQCTVVESWHKTIQRKILNFEKISDPTQRPWYYRVNYEKRVCLSPEDSIEEAMDLINTVHLHPLSKCLRESFVHYLKTGEAAEIDTDELLDDRILLQRERITSAMELKRGDHIERPLALAPSHAQHHMLVVDPIDDEHCEVIHFKVHRNASKVLKFKKGDVVCEIVNIFDQGQVSRIRYPERINPLEGMKTLTELSGDGGKFALKQITGMEEYNLKENNCEHLITIATIGFPVSIQVDKIIFQALQCSKVVVRSCRGSFVSHASNYVSNCYPGDVPIQAAYHTHAIGHAVATKGTVMAAEAGAKAAAKSTVKSAAKSAAKATTKAATKATTKSATKASAKTTSKAAFEAGSEAAISGTILGAIGGIAFGVNLVLEAPFYIRGAYKLHRKKKFDMISKEEYQREMIKITFKSVNTVVGGTLGAVAGQVAIPVPVLGAVVGGFVGGVLGQACGYLEGKAMGYVIRDPTKVTLPILNTPTYLKVEELEEKRSKSVCPHTSEDTDSKQTKWC